MELTDQDRFVPVVQGEFKISHAPEIVFTTVLGSCVAACLFDEDMGIGGVNHFLLPGETGALSTDLKYGTLAMELLINALLKAGARRGALAVKLFGGAQITAGFSDIGAKNIAFAREYIAREGFSLVAESLGGRQARRVHFRPANGQARMMLVAPDLAPPITLPKKRAAAPDVTLF